MDTPPPTPPAMPLPPGAAVVAPAVPPPPGSAVSPSGVWIRALAIGIDSLVWIAVAIPMSRTHGSTGSSAIYLRLVVNGHTYQLAGWPLVVTSVSWLAYMTIAEFAFGASLGKWITGRRVIDVSSGGSASLGSSVVRNLLRLVDGLFVYAVGAIVAWTSALPQRIGDHLGHTLVVRKHADASSGTVLAGASATPTRRPLAGAIALTVLALLVGTYAVVDHASTNVYADHGVRFEYPASWTQVSLENPKILGSPPLFLAVVSPDDVGDVQVAGYKLRSTADDADLAKLARPELTDLGNQLAATIQGGVTQAPTPTSVGGFPGLEQSVSNDTVSIEIVSIFHDGMQYVVRCESRAADAGDVTTGCDEVLRTFSIQGG